MSKVSIIISTYTKVRYGCVLRCIESLKKQTSPPKEIILVLDPCESLKDLYESCALLNDVKIVISEKPGLSNARNEGVKIAKGEIIAFIDDDAIADKDWLNSMVKNYDDPSVLGVGGLVKPLWENGRPQWFPEELDWVVGCSYKGLPKHKTFIRSPIGCNMSLKRDVFKKIGYFRTDIGRVGKNPNASEETEFFIRMLMKIPESKIVYDPPSLVYHMVPKGRANLKYLVRRSFYEGYSKALIINAESKHPDTLSTENRYLRYLLKFAMPSRLKQIHKLESFSQLFTLLLSTSLVLTGYFVGRFSKSLENPY